MKERRKDKRAEGLESYLPVQCTLKEKKKKVEIAYNIKQNESNLKIWNVSNGDSFSILRKHSTGSREDSVVSYILRVQARMNSSMERLDMRDEECFIINRHAITDHMEMNVWCVKEMKYRL